MRNFLPYLTVATLPCMLHAATKAKVDASKPEPTPAATVYQTEATYGVPELGNDFAADGEGCYRYQPVSDTEIDLKLCDVTIDPQTVLTYNGNKYMWVNDTLENFGTTSICGLKFDSDVMSQALITLPADILQRPAKLPLKPGQSIRVSFLLPINPASLNPLKPEAADLWLDDTWHKCEAVKAPKATSTPKKTTGLPAVPAKSNAIKPRTKTTTTATGATMEATTSQLVTDTGGVQAAGAERVQPKGTTTSSASGLRPWPLLLSALVVAVGALIVNL